MAGDDTTAGEREDLDQLAARVDGMESKLDQILRLISGDGKPRPAAPDEDAAGGSFEDRVRAEIERAEADKRKAADAEADKSDRQSVRDRLAKLEEKAPEPPQPRRQRAMWGKR